MKHMYLILAFIVTLVVSACGGGGGGGSTTGGGGTTAGGGTTPTATYVGFTGIAAVGFPIVGGTVQVKCAAGSLPGGTTDSTGAWFAEGQSSPPCAVQVSGGTINGAANTTPYHSFAMTSGTVSVTPLTDLMVANLAGTATPEVWFAGLTGDTLSPVTTTSVNTAITKLNTALSGLAPLSTINPITTTFTATPGNTGDDSLAALRAAMSTTGVSHTNLLVAAATPSFSSAAVTTLNAALPAAYASTISGKRPTITHVSPYAGVDVGSSLNIQGTHFDLIPANNTVTFNDTPATVTAATSIMLTVTVPNVAGGPIVVSTAAAGTSLPYKDFIVGFPEVIGMSQYSGSVGTAVTISGTHFSTVPANNIVEFTGANGRVTATVTGATATSISTIVPSGATTGIIYVTTPLGTNNLATVFTVSTSGSSSAPTITSFSPASGAAGTTVTITGTNFSTTTANNTVTFNGTAATVTAATTTSLTVTVPDGATSGKVSVTTAGVAAMSSSSFTIAASSGGSTLTMAAPFTSITGLTYNAGASSTASPSFPGYLWSFHKRGDIIKHYMQVWTNPAGDTLELDYTVDIFSDGSETMNAVGYIAVKRAGAINTLLSGGGYYSCEISYSSACSNWGISIDKSAGTMTLSGTPIFELTTGMTNGQTGTMSGTFTFPNLPPYITYLSTWGGFQGNEVVIHGANFHTTATKNTVKFNGTLGTSKAATDSQLTVIAPSGVTSGPVSVTTPGGTASGSFTVPNTGGTGGTGSTGGGSVNCNTAWTGNSADIQVSSLCLTACSYLQIGNTSAKTSTCAILGSSYGSAATSSCTVCP